MSEDKNKEELSWERLEDILNNREVYHRVLYKAYPNPILNNPAKTEEGWHAPVKVLPGVLERKVKDIGFLFGYVDVYSGLQDDCADTSIGYSKIHSSKPIDRMPFYAISTEGTFEGILNLSRIKRYAELGTIFVPEIFLVSSERLNEDLEDYNIYLFGHNIDTILTVLLALVPEVIELQEIKPTESTKDEKIVIRYEDYIY